MGEWPLEAWAKLPGYVALLGATGAVVTLTLTGRPGELAASAARIARVAALLGLVGIVLRAFAHAVTIDGPAGAFQIDTLRLVVIDSRWGGSWRWHAATAVAIAVASWRLGAGARVLSYGVTVAAALAVAPWLGHGAGDLWRGALHSLHLAVTGAWLGTVVVLVLAARRVGPAALTPVIARFSPWALACATAAFASGLGLAWLYLGSVPALVQTRYGRLLLLKLALIAGIGLCGYLNWQRVRQRHAPRLGWIQLEALLAVLAVAVTAWLSETEHS